MYKVPFCNRYKKFFYPKQKASIRLKKGLEKNENFPKKIYWDPFKNST